MSTFFKIEPRDAVPLQPARLPVLVLILTAPLAAAPTFQHDILPWFEKSCISCHGAKTLGGLDLRTLSAILSGGKSGSAIVPGNPGASLMVKLVEGGKMPMSGPAATREQKALLREWIEKGQFPAQSGAAAEEIRKRSREKQLRHWSFAKPAKPPVPAVRDSKRVRTPVDAFVLESLEKSGWSFNPDASPATLIRRSTSSDYHRRQTWCGSSFRTLALQPTNS